MRKILKDDHLQKAFQHSGYVQVPMLEEAEVAALLSRMATLSPDDSFAPTNGFATYHCSFLDSSKQYKRKAFELMKETFTPVQERYLEGYTIISCNFYVKPPGRGELQIHQNWPAIPDINDTTVTIWCPLVDATIRNGTIQVVAGSHKILPHIEAPGSPGYFDRFQREMIDKYLRPMPMPAGQGLIFDDSLVHYSADNLSDQPRIAVQILCVPADATPVFFLLSGKKGEQFEMIHADEEFYLQTQPNELGQRQPGWKSEGFVPNKNRVITEQEFGKLLLNGSEIRRAIYR